MVNYILESGGDRITAGADDYIKVLAGAVRTDDLEDWLPIVVLGADVTIHNYGTVDAGPEGEGLYCDADRTRIINFESGVITGQIGIGLSGADTQVINYGTITSTGFYGVFLRDTVGGVLDNRGLIEGITAIDSVHDYTIRNSGTISAIGNNFDAITLNTATGRTRIFNDGAIVANQIDGWAISIGEQVQGVEIYNSGTVIGQVGIFSAAPVRVVNDGTISGTAAGIVARGGILDTSMTVINNGAIENDLFLSDGQDVVRNAGLIDGNLELNYNYDRVFNSGTITGVVDLGWGNDRYIASGDATAALVLGGDGNDLIQLANTGGRAEGGSGNDKIVAGSGGTQQVGGAWRDLLFAGAGIDTFIYQTASDSITASPDVIIGFERGVDRIDLDAAVNGALAFNGTGGFSGGGQASVIYQTRTDGHVNVLVDVDGDLNADMRIVVKDTAELTMDDFGIMPDFVL